MDKYFKSDLTNFLKSDVYIGYEGLDNNHNSTKNALLDECYYNEEAFLKFVISLINSETATQDILCEFENEYFRGDHRSEEYFIYGKGQLRLVDEILLYHSPSKNFDYRGEDIEWDLSGHLSHMSITAINQYDGSFSFSGFLASNEGERYVEFYSAHIYNTVRYYFIREDSPAWCQYILQGFRFYSVKSYQTSFLMFFIALDAFIEFNIEKLKFFYQCKYQQVAEFAMNAYINQDKYPVEEFIKTHLVEEPINIELEKLKNSSRKLIYQKLDQILFLATELSDKQRNTSLKHFSLFEKIRNSIAHGNTLELEQLKSEFSLINKYISMGELDLKKLSVSLLIELAGLIHCYTH